MNQVSLFPAKHNVFFSLACIWYLWSMALMNCVVVVHFHTPEHQMHACIHRLQARQYHLDGNTNDLIPNMTFIAVRQLPVCTRMAEKSKLLHPCPFLFHLATIGSLRCSLEFCMGVQKFILWLANEVPYLQLPTTNKKVADCRHKSTLRTMPSHDNFSITGNKCRTPNNNFQLSNVCVLCVALAHEKWLLRNIAVYCWWNNTMSISMVDDDGLVIAKCIYLQVRVNAIEKCVHISFRVERVSSSKSVYYSFDPFYFVQCSNGLREVIIMPI